MTVDLNDTVALGVETYLLARGRMPGSYGLLHRVSYENNSTVKTFLSE